jgi:menaquinone-dependent protoporphyrinogen oxidase
VPTGFLSVSLSAAQAEKRAEAEGYVRALLDETGWRPDVTQIAPGALRYTQYGFIKRTMMRKIAEEGGLPTDTSRDHELTNWKEIAAFGDAFLEHVGDPA